ncbi:hypothetical protein M9H77_18325 [Catharanthus roseus]|uniref:Uncharacterized protein n=1 Tax=Catharanthus roseus TaxID=4058 RepID=A0ACC0B769_CATRO|nr:hypothetical protein M9H77_18325 [Catharanthus roseus]
MAMKVNTYLIVTRYLSSRTSDWRPYVTLGCERGCENKPRTNPRVDDEEEEVQAKRRGPYVTKKFGCPFKLKGEQMAMCNITLLEVIGMTPTGKNFTVATAFMQNEQATTYRWVLQHIKHLHFSSAMSAESQQDLNAHEPNVIIKDRLKKSDVLRTKWRKKSDFLHYFFTTWLNPLAHKFVRVWTGRVMHFVVGTTNRAKSEHSVLKLWLSTFHDDLDIVFLNIDSLIRSQIVDIKNLLENSRTKEKFKAKSNLILRNISNKISHLALKKIWVEIKRAVEIINDPKNKCGHYMRTSHGLPCSCELITRRFLYIYPFIENWKNVIGDGNCGYRVVLDFVFGDERPSLEVHRRMVFELEHAANIYKCMTDAQFPLYTCNRFIIVVIELDFISSGECGGETMPCIHMYNKSGTAGTLVHVSISRYQGASSHNALINAFLTWYCLLFADLRCSRGRIGCVGMH